jgi:hypothetical protein
VIKVEELRDRMNILRQRTTLRVVYWLKSICSYWYWFWFAYWFKHPQNPLFPIDLHIDLRPRRINIFLLIWMWNLRIILICILICILIYAPSKSDENLINIWSTTAKIWSTSDHIWSNIWSKYDQNLVKIWSPYGTRLTSVACMCVALR